MTEPISTTQQVTIAVPGSQVIAVLLAGLLMAFSFQLIVAILQVIAGLVALGIKIAMKLESSDTLSTTLPEDTLSGEAFSEYDPETITPPPVARRRRRRRQKRRFSIPGRNTQQPGRDTSNSLPTSSPDQSSDVTNTIGLITGLGLMIGINLAIFPASFFAVKLSRVDRPILGMISGLVLWSAYFLILTWLSSQTLGAIVQTILGGVVDGVGQLLKAIASLFRRSSTVSEKTVKQEIQTALANFDLDSRIQTYVKDLPSIRFDLQPVEEVLKLLITMPALQSLAGQQLLDTVDRNQLDQLLQQHTQFSEQDIAQILDQLAPLWNRVVNQAPKKNTAAELVKLLNEMPSSEIATKKTEERNLLPTLTDGNVGQVETKSEESESEDLNEEKPNNLLIDTDSLESSDIAGELDASGMLFALLDMVDADSLLDELLNQVDLSEWDVARLWQQFQQLTAKDVKPLTILPEDVENYLLSAAVWELNPTVLSEDIPDLFFDPEADPVEMKHQLNLLNQDTFMQTLLQRGDLSPEQVESLATQLESLRQSAISQANEALEQEQLNQLGQAFKAEIEVLPPDKILPEQLTETLESLLEVIAPETILALNTQLEPLTLKQWLQENTQLSSEVLPTAVTALIEYVQTRAGQIESRRAEVQSAIDEIQAKLTAYLTYTALDKLTEASIRQKLQTLVEEAGVDSGELDRALPNLEAKTLHEILSHCQGLAADQREQMVSHIQACWREQMPKIQESPIDTQSFAQRLTATLEEMMRSQNIEQLSLEDLKPHLLSLIRDPELTLNNLTQELSQIDWSPLLTVMMELRFDGSQMRELLQWLEAQIYAAARLPRRWLTRLQDRERRFEKSIQRYLQHNPKEALNPKKMHRDLQKMLQKEVKRAKIVDTIEQTVVGVNQKTGQKLPELPEEKAIATILAHRDDITSSERSQISHSLQTTWQEITEQFELAQQEAQAALTNLWEKLTKTLNALKLSNLDLELIDRELDNLLVPLSSSVEQLSHTLSLWLPDSPLSALRSRIESWNQAAIAQLIQARDDLSDTVNSYIQARLDRVRREIDRELAILEKEALKQLNEIRRAAAIAATWFLVIALSSAASSALAGLLAVR
ncbi:MAG: hypothetical protein QNJ72_19220 [Pleurocapsa sp. MO_226.B13]|nr:hypothetical protein [Pleurocapsa sp. MO_226.B13]